MKNGVIFVRVDAPMKAAVEAAARDDDRAVAAWVRRVLAKELQLTYLTCTKCGAGFMINGVCSACEGKAGE